MGCNEYDGIEKKVALWIEGKNSRIGIILPEKSTTAEDMTDLHRTIAEIAIRTEQRKHKKDENPPENNEAATSA